MKRATGRGFTLIELMIVVAIIGILASIAVPHYIVMTCRAKQTEAKSALKGIFVAEDSYRAEYDTYLSGALADLLIIGFVQAGPRPRYRLDVPTASQTTFRATAAGSGIGEMFGDAWEITQENTLTVTNSVCESF